MRFYKNSRFKNVKFGSSKKAYHRYRNIAKGYASYNRSKRDPKGKRVHILLIRQSKGTFLKRNLGYSEPSVSFYPLSIGGFKVF